MEKIEKFRELTGDINPLHVNEDFAANYGFGGRVVYGMLSASLISTLGGVYLPGRYCLIQQIEGCKFLSPVYIGDILTVTGTVKELNDSVRQAVIQVSIRNQESKKVVKAILKVGFLE
ncbi:MAG: MaoC family dehydratase [Alistipes sp.]|nr:MaoC family dehydratase [Alistipes sp.]